MHRLMAITLQAASFTLVLGACTAREVATGAAVGGAAYEYSNKRAMDQLREDLSAGRITQEEYDRRKREIEGRSVIY